MASFLYARQVMLLLAIGLAMLPAHVCQDRAPPDCEQLGFGPGVMPTSGSDLGTCSIQKPQCCSASDTTSMNDTAKNILKEGLTLELRETSSMFSTIIERIENYFNTMFHSRWQSFFPNPGRLIDDMRLPEIYNRTFTELLGYLTFNNTSQRFSASSFLDQNIIEAITKAVGNIVSSGTNETLRACTVRHLNGTVSNNVYRRMAQLLETIQRCTTSLGHFVWLLENYIQNTNFKFPSNCVDRLVSIFFCDRCQDKIPPLCSNTCGALIRGCNSPYHGAFGNEFNILLNLSIQVLEVLNNSLDGLFTEGPRLFNETMVKQLTQACETAIQFPESNNTTQSLNITQSLIPGERILELRQMIGRGLSYGEAGPMICQPSSDEQQFCTVSPSAERESNYSITAFSTSTCQCYGVNEEQETDTEKFELNSTEDQAKNPVICLNCTELKELRSTVGSEGFLMMGGRIEGLPMGVMVPQLIDDFDYTCGGYSPLKSVLVYNILLSLGGLFFIIS